LHFSSSFCDENRMVIWSLINSPAFIIITEKFAYSINYIAAIKGESSSKDNLLAVAKQDLYRFF